MQIHAYVICDMAINCDIPALPRRVTGDGRDFARKSGKFNGNRQLPPLVQMPAPSAQSHPRLGTERLQVYVNDDDDDIIDLTSVKSHN